jgi:ATP synthase protein I
MPVMADEPDPDRLRALEARLTKVREKVGPKPRGTAGTGFSQGEMAWRMVIELVTGMVIGMGIGYGADMLFGTRPIFLVIFALLGFAAGVKTMLRTATQMNAQAAGQPAADMAEAAGTPEAGKKDGERGG